MSCRCTIARCELCRGKKKGGARLALVLVTFLHMCVPVGTQPAPSLSFTIVSSLVAASHCQVDEREIGRARDWLGSSHTSSKGGKVKPCLGKLLCSRLVNKPLILQTHVVLRLPPFPIKAVSCFLV